MPTERCLMVNSMVFNYTPYPNAAKEYLRFMMEEEQYAPWLEACIGYWNHPLQTYEASDLDRAIRSTRRTSDGARESLWDGYKGSSARPRRRCSPSSSSCRWWPRCAPGSRRPEEAAAEAERRAKRYYES